MSGEGTYMQIDNVSEYLSQIMHTNDTSTVKKSEHSNSSTQTTDATSFDDLYKACVDTQSGNTTKDSTDYKDIIGLLGGNNSKAAATLLQAVTKDERTPIQVAQDAYSDFLSIAAGAVSGTSSDKQGMTNSLDNDDKADTLSQAISDYLDSLNETAQTAQASQTTNKSKE
jgi:hypothetical protein